MGTCPRRGMRIPGTPASNPNPQGSTWQMELAPYTTAALRANNIYR